MAWSAPATYSTGQIVTAVDLNLIRDNLKYLKGQAGAVTIEDQIALTLNANASNGLNVTNANAGASAFAHINLINDGGSAAGFFRGSSTTAAYAGANALNIGMIGAHPLALFTNNTVRQWIDSNGNVNFGATAPVAKLQAVGAGGGVLFLSANAVTTLQTLAAAGTVTKGMFYWLSDINNTGGGLVEVLPSHLGLSGSATYANTDTMTIAVTAGGAITIARTTGSNGSHQVNMLVLYF